MPSAKRCEDSQTGKVMKLGRSAGLLGLSGLQMFHQKVLENVNYGIKYANGKYPNVCMNNCSRCYASQRERAVLRGEAHSEAWA